MESAIQNADLIYAYTVFFIVGAMVGIFTYKIYKDGGR